MTDSELHLHEPRPDRGGPTPKLLNEPPSGIQLLALCAMIFFLVGTNANPLWWSSAIPSVVIGIYLLLTRNPRAIAAVAMGLGNRAITLSIFALSFFIIVSAIAIPNPTTIEATVERALIPPLIYMSTVGLALTRRQFLWILAAILAGTMVALLRATLAFYQEWGMPDLVTLLWARYDTFRMTSYMSATFGNVGHMGAYLTLVLPILLVLVVKYPIGRVLRFTCLVLLALGVLHLFISGARAAILTSLLAIAIVLLRMGLRGGFTLAAALLAISLVTFVQASSSLGENDILERFFPAQVGTGVDESIVERGLSIQEGWGHFVDNPLFGIGPDMSSELNTYTVAHQSFVYVLSELGIFGGAAFIFLNLAVFIKLGKATLRRSRSGLEFWEVLWLIGPACWLLYGMIAGVTFNLSLALLWLGTAYAMLGLATSTIVAPAPAKGRHK